MKSWQLSLVLATVWLAPITDERICIGLGAVMMVLAIVAAIKDV